MAQPWSRSRSRHSWTLSGSLLLLCVVSSTETPFLRPGMAKPGDGPRRTSSDTMAGHRHLATLGSRREVQAATARRFFGGESEVDRLRRENEELKKKLGRESEGGGNFIEKIGNGIKSLFGGNKEPSALADGPSFGGLGLLGSLLQPAIGMMGSLLKGSQDDIDRVLSEAQTLITRSGRVGSSVECGPIYRQSYSSMNINGRQTTQVQLQFQVQGDRTGMASCSASIGPDGVDFQDLSLDGQPVATSGPSTSGNVIDVER
ncbi:unnamed protein product [Durusdinium trenchii]|uniref:Uncharacterized protein n=2 Tax=Durusdinium trenchii TaxID=1381693 RepID=A0ABP0P849_9DINO